MKELTKAEEQVMQILWDIEQGFVKDIIEQLPEPKPAYNTVSTIVRILERKQFVGYESFGKSHRYHPLISKEAYTKGFMHGFVDRFFSRSYKNLVSFFSKNEQLSIREMEEIIDLLQTQVDKKKGEEH